MDELGNVSPRSRRDHRGHRPRPPARAEVVRGTRFDCCIRRRVRHRHPAADRLVLVRLPALRHRRAVPRSGTARSYATLVAHVRGRRCCQSYRSGPRLGILRTHPLECAATRSRRQYSSPQHGVAAVVRWIVGLPVRAEGSHANRARSCRWCTVCRTRRRKPRRVGLTAKRPGTTSPVTSHKRHDRPDAEAPFGRGERELPVRRSAPTVRCARYVRIAYFLTRSDRGSVREIVCECQE